MMKKLAILALVVSSAFSSALAANNSNNCTVNISSDDLIFTGSQLKPDVKKVICGNADYTEADFAEVTYGENVNAGTEAGSVTVTLKKTGDVVTKKFDIAPKGVSILIDNVEKELGGKTPNLTWRIDEDSNLGTLQADTLDNFISTLNKKLKLVVADGVEQVGAQFKISKDPSVNLPTLFPNYDFLIEPGMLLITKTKINIVVNSVPKVYGKNDPKFTYNKQNNQGKDVSVSDDKLGKIVLTREPGENAGSYRIKVEIDGKEYKDKPAVVDGCDKAYCKETDDYYIYVIWGTLVIEPAPATVTVDDVSKVYGETTPKFTYKVTGLVGEDQLKNVTLSCDECSSDNLENVGDYLITASVDDPNYKVTVKNGELKVSPKAVTVTVNNATKTYGDADPKFSFETKGLVRDNESLKLATISRFKGEEAGLYPINVTFASNANPNYTVTIKEGSLTIEPRPVVLTVTDISKKFGENDPALTYTVENLASFDGVEVGLKDVELSCEKSDDAGSYPIIATVVDSANTNYIITIANEGTFKILPNDDDIVVTIKGKSKTVEYDGKEKLVKGYEISANNEAYSLKFVKFTGDSTVSGKAAGKYPMGLTKDMFENTSVNYKSITFEVVDGTLEITPRSVIVTAKADTITYGDATPTEFTWTVDNLVKGETLDNIHLSIAETGLLPAGEYPLVFDQQSPTSTNYVVSSYETASLTVKKKTVTIAIDDAEKVYSEPDPAEFTYKVSGLVEGDVLPTITVAREAGENVLKNSTGGDSTYRISATISSENPNPNYLVKFKQGHFTIKPYTKRITVAIFGEEVLAKYTGKEITVDKKFDVSLIPMEGEGLPEGYTYSLDFVTYKGEPTMTATELGRFPMGLVADDFENISPNFEKVSFIVSMDGEFVIDEDGPTSIALAKPVNTLKLSAMNRRILVNGSKVGNRYAVYDMQGNVVRSGSVESSNFEIPVSKAGVYIVRVGASAERIRIK